MEAAIQPRPLSLTARTLYAELRELALAIGARDALGKVPGSVVTKAVRGRPYLYYQYRDLDGRTKQAYLGPDEAPIRRLAEGVRDRSDDRAQDRQRLDELRAAFVAAGGFATEHGPMRVLKAFADAGILLPGPGGGVLVGTHAFNALGNLLGVRWASQIQTQDIDLAGEAETDVDIAVGRKTLPAPDVLTRLGMGFVPVPALDPRSPSTSFRVRGRDLRVDLLAPLVGRATSTPVFIPAFNASAQPVRFLDYLMEQPVPAVIVGRRLLAQVSVPCPERFALHKLLLSESRPAALANKSAKDRIQAAQLLQVLVEEAPDGLAEAKARLIGRGKGWREKLERAFERVRGLAPEATDQVAAS